MQAAKKAVESIKETAANIGASAKSGLEKTKATVEEKAERMTAHDPIEKERATEKKDERIHQAELAKQEAREHNSAAKQSATAGIMGQGRYTTTGPASGLGPEPASYSTTGPGSGTTTYSTTGPNYGLGSGPNSELGSGPNEGVMGSNLSGTNTGMGGRSIAYDSNVGGSTTGTGRGDFN